MKTKDTFTVHGVCSIFNAYAALIEISNDGNFARLAFDGGNGRKVSRWQEIKYTSSEEPRPYVRHYNRRYYLDEFMRP